MEFEATCSRIYRTIALRTGKWAYAFTVDGCQARGKLTIYSDDDDLYRIGDKVKFTAAQVRRVEVRAEPDDKEP